MAGRNESEAAARKRLVEELARDVHDERVLQAIGRVPRHLFVPESARYLAYENRAQSIGDEQTISQPLMVALMTELLNLRGGERGLEVGTGSRYHAAVL